MGLSLGSASDASPTLRPAANLGRSELTIAAAVMVATGAAALLTATGASGSLEVCTTLPGAWLATASLPGSAVLLLAVIVLAGLDEGMRRGAGVLARAAMGLVHRRSNRAGLRVSRVGRARQGTGGGRR